MSLDYQLDWARSTSTPEPMLSDKADSDSLKFSKAVKRAMKGRQGMVVLAITSRTQGAFISDETPYGAGKTTLAMRLARQYGHFDGEYQRYDRVDAEDPFTMTEEGWEPVKDGLFDDPRKLRFKLNEVLAAGKRTNVAIWDDVQMSMPSETGKSKEVAKVVGDIHRWRFSLGLLILTFPDMKEIASSLARLVQFEAIVYQQAKWELHMYHYRKDWKHPRRDWERMEKLSGTSLGGPEFAAVPPGIQKWYDEWRIGKMLGQKEPSLREKGLAW